MAAVNATMVLLGLRTGKTYSIDVYAPDAVATKFTFNAAGAAVAGSATSYRVGEDCLIRDINVVAGPTATGFVIEANGNVINGGALRWANQLCALPNRPILAIPIRSGDFISATQF